MAAGRRGKDLIGPLLVVNLVVFLIVLGLAGWSLDKFINGEQNHPHLGGNSSTSFMLIFALMAGVVGACYVLPGLVHLRAWRSDSLAGAGSLAIVSWAITALAFGGKRLQTLEALIFISLLSQLLYLIVLHAGVFDNSYGPGYRSYANDHGGIATGHEPQNSGTSAVI